MISISSSSRGRFLTKNKRGTTNFRLCIFAEDYIRIGKLVSRIPYAETGGNLFGLWTNQGNAVVLVATGPGQNCKRSNVSFYQDIPYMKQVGDLVTGDYPLCHIGEWHSHHQMQLFQPSGGDCNTIQRNYPTGSQGFVLMIANILHDRNVKLSPYKFKDERSPYEKGDIEILKEENPFMKVAQILEYIEEGEEKGISHQEMSDREKQDRGEPCFPAIEQNDKEKRAKRDGLSSPSSHERSRSRSRSPHKKKGFPSHPTRQDNPTKLVHMPSPPSQQRLTQPQMRPIRRYTARVSSQTNIPFTKDKQQENTLGTTCSSVPALLQNNTPLTQADIPQQRTTPSRVQTHIPQWYEIQQETLKTTLGFLASLADDKKTVNTTRDTLTMNITMEITHHDHKWALDFPPNFPRGMVKLKTKQVGSDHAYSFPLVQLGDIDSFMTKVKSTLQEECTKCIITRYQYNKNKFSSEDVSLSRQVKPQETADHDIYSHNRTSQWYETQPNTPKIIYDFVASLADDEESVNMCRENTTKKLIMEFIHHGYEWSIYFPNNFPIGVVKLEVNNYSCSIEGQRDIDRFMTNLKYTLERECATCKALLTNKRSSRHNMLN